MNDILTTAYEVITPILLCVAVGVWFGRRFDPDPRMISRLSLYVMLPALVFVSIAESDIQGGDVTLLALVSVLAIVLLTGIAWIAAKPLRLPPTTQSAFILTVMLMNTGNFGLPFIEFALGDAGLQRAAVVFVTQAILTYTIGIYVASSGTATVRQGLTNILTNPLPYAAIAGFVVNTTGASLPLPLARAVGIYADGSVPLLLLLLGVQLSMIRIDIRFRARLRALVASAGLRLLLTPLIVLAITAVLGIDGITRDVLVLQLSMPTAVNAIVLSNEFGSDVDLAAPAILVTTLASVATLSVLVALL